VAAKAAPSLDTGMFRMEGGLDLSIQGQPTRTLKPGDAFQVPPETPHAGNKNGEKKTKLAITYVVEKGKPLVTPVPG
jgi:quercetin dioxygenase-like cupin family protein